MDEVLKYLSGPSFEPLAKHHFGLAQEGLVLLAMVTDKRVSELQALSFSVSFQGEDFVLHY